MSLRRRRALHLALLAVAGLSLACRSAAPRDVRPGWSERGVASWYGEPFHGRRTASGEVYDMEGMTAAHQTLPFGTVLEVRNLDNGRRTRVVVTDRGPFVGGRILDLSRAAARELKMIGPGVARVEIRVRRVPGNGSASRPQTAPDAASGPWTVQVGAFADRDRALDLALSLEPRYPDVRVESALPWHRVRVGAWRRRAPADRARARLAAEGLPAVVMLAEE